MLRSNLRACHHNNTVGGLKAHICRRLFHLSLALVPFTYDRYALQVASFLHISVKQMLWAFIGIVIVFELIRIKFSWKIPGQRDYEINRISAWAWGAFGLAMVLLFSPGMQYSVPIIVSFALVDPLMGEMRRFCLPSWFVVVAGVLVVALIWYLSAIVYGLPLWLIAVMAPLTVASELPRLKWIDDNAMLLLIPLCTVLLIHYWL